MKFCIDCKHCNVIELHTRNDCYICLVKQESSRDMVTGKKRYSNQAYCKNMRNGECGKEAKFFEPTYKGGEKRS